MGEPQQRTAYMLLCGPQVKFILVCRKVCPNKINVWPGLNTDLVVASVPYWGEFSTFMTFQHFYGTALVILFERPCPRVCSSFTSGD